MPADLMRFIATLLVATLFFMLQPAFGFFVTLTVVAIAILPTVKRPANDQDPEPLLRELAKNRN